MGHPRRPRCTCGDLFSEHDWRDQSEHPVDPCWGPVCTALMSLPPPRYEDPCGAYTPRADHYQSLREILPDYELTKAELPR
ncbi:MAG TPA: hypothetical protein VF821_06900 [Lentzea sp.]